MRKDECRSEKVEKKVNCAKKDSDLERREGEGGREGDDYRGQVRSMGSQEGIRVFV